ncbi:hypothetical protein BpHYR1_025540 [Brachionus plicatilis]|uniref:Uncharacterized protein n=1 Tax=Brachionus plicatilis TaxID=10195 RepID=A0A3M7SMQ6_BRAPC|nr:hypothetical protein BpHYR1_025540 [Brachionus plicatilis]
MNLAKIKIVSNLNLCTLSGLYFTKHFGFSFIIINSLQIKGCLKTKSEHELITKEFICLQSARLTLKFI